MARTGPRLTGGLVGVLDEIVADYNCLREEARAALARLMGI